MIVICDFKTLKVNCKRLTPQLNNGKT